MDLAGGPWRERQRGLVHKHRKKNGLVVNGDYVTIYALFNEHFQGYQTLWNGEYGRTYFFQCESPYDAPNQSAYRSEGGKKNGYAAYKVAEEVDHHEAYAFGIYDVLIHEIMIHSSVEVPEKRGVVLKNICNNSLSNGRYRGFKFVINETQKVRMTPGAIIVLTLLIFL